MCIPKNIKLDTHIMPTVQLKFTVNTPVYCICTQIQHKKCKNCNGSGVLRTKLHTKILQTVCPKCLYGNIKEQKQTIKYAFVKAIHIHGHGPTYEILFRAPRNSIGFDPVHCTDKYLYHTKAEAKAAVNPKTIEL